MSRVSMLVLALLLHSTACFGQTSSSDSQTLQALLSEVHQLRLELQKTTIAAQRAQILIYRLQGQEASVARASQRLDEARDKLGRVQDEQKHVAAEVKQFEDFIKNSENPIAQRNEIEARLPQAKSHLESTEFREQQLQSQEIEADRLLREEEARLSDLRAQLDRLDKTLENAGPTK